MVNTVATKTNQRNLLYHLRWLLCPIVSFTQSEIKTKRIFDTKVILSSWFLFQWLDNMNLVFYRIIECMNIVLEKNYFDCITTFCISRKLTKIRMIVHCLISLIKIDNALILFHNKVAILHPHYFKSEYTIKINCHLKIWHVKFNKSISDRWHMYK